MPPCPSPPLRPLALCDPEVMSLAFDWPAPELPLLECKSHNTRGPEASECSTDTGADGSHSDLESVQSVERGALRSLRATGAAIIFDWDDTLLATTWIRTARNGRRPEDLRRHAELLESVLRTACAVARVSIVTAAQRPWVTYSANRFLPTLELPRLLEELGIGVYYALEEAAYCAAKLEDHDWVALKRKAMARSISDMCMSPSSVVSVGDSACEREALVGLLRGKSGTRSVAARAWCKTIKLDEKLSLEVLGKKLRRLLPLLPDIAAIEKDFDGTLR